MMTPVAGGVEDRRLRYREDADPVREPNHRWTRKKKIALIEAINPGWEELGPLSGESRFLDSAPSALRSE
jgi:hypothetical protein